MISYLPEIYPDELAYSWFCRYYVHSGCLTHRMALKEILYSRCNNPSKEFLGHLNPDMILAIQKMYPIEAFVTEHTMFPQYARFIPLEQRKTALYRICHDFCDVHHLFAVLPRSNDDLYLKYCPLCVKEDREQYGETYWHRVHQIRNMRLCAKHNCRLIQSSVTAKSEQTFTLFPAESYVEKEEPIIEIDPLKISFAEYMSDVFHAPMDFEMDIQIRAVLYHAMKATKYMKSSGKARETKRFSEDINAYYSGLDFGGAASMYQIQRVLLGDRFDFSIVCQIAFYIGIDTRNLTTPTLTDEQIEQEQNTHYVKGRPVIDWAAYDAETAPIIERVARSIYDGASSEIGRPERVSEKNIYRVMELPGHRLEKLPTCRAILDKYTESYEESWARRLIWAYQKLKVERKSTRFYWSDMRKLSGVKKKNINQCVPYLCRHTDETTASAIISIINGTQEAPSP